MSVAAISSIACAPRWMTSVAPWAARSARRSPGGLGDLGDRELGAQRGRGGHERGHAGRDVPRDTELVEPAHLLGGGAVDREVAGVQSGDVLVAVVRTLVLGDDLVEREVLRVDEPRVVRRVGENLR